MSEATVSKHTDVEFTIGSAELREQVIERAADKLRESIDTGDYGHLDRIVKEATDKAVSRYIEHVIVPRIEKEIGNITFQATNTWGEAHGKKFTFREYLIDRAEKWLEEKVDHNGKPKGTDSYSWHPYQTRIAHMVHEHLHWSIKNSVEQMLKTANEKIVGGIQETIKMKLAEVQTALELKTTVKSK